MPSQPLKLTPEQTTAMVVTERLNSILSLIGVFFILLTFLFSSAFNKPINRLIFFASWGNLGMIVAALISQEGPRAGQDSALCQWQAFLIQMFLGVDATWALCMSINVYLAFFRAYSIERLRALDIRYLLACYGLAFVPSLVFLFINVAPRGKVYGPAILWCWIDVRWDFLRIVVLYALVWIAITFAGIVYVMAGRTIYAKRKHLQGFLNPFNENPFTNTVTTEIEITHEARRKSISALPEQGVQGFDTKPDFDPYSVNIEVAPLDKQSTPLPNLLNVRNITRDVATQEANAEAWLYARVAFLFFVVLLIVWLPPSINRVYALIRPDDLNFGLNYAASFTFTLQGFLNCVVYMITSQTACKKLWKQLCGAQFSNRRTSIGSKRHVDRNDTWGKSTAGRARLGSRDSSVREAYR